MRDVAERAGVSVTTASNVVRRWQYIASDTRARVEAAIADLGYSPHSIAQGLRTGRTQAIGLIVPDLANLYFAVMVETIERAAGERGYNVLVFSTHNSPQREAQAIEQIAARWVDGLLIVQSTQTARTSELLSHLDIPMVALDRIQPDYTGAWCRIDNYALVELAVAHLRQLGHTDIALIVAPPDIGVGEARVQAFISLAGETRRLIHTQGDFGLTGGYSAIAQLLDSGGPLPTAICASNDMMAVGALRALGERGIRVPTDVSVIGMDDVPICAFLNPALTTVRQPIELLAHEGIGVLLSLIAEKPTATHIVLQPELIVRETTAPPRKAS